MHTRPAIAANPSIGFRASEEESSETAHRSTGPATITCPACGGENAPDAVFCSNTHCHKALGDFRYVLEELRAETKWHESLADKVTDLVARPHFVAFHFVWFAIWIAINTGLIAAIRVFDEAPFFWLVTILAVETILITIFVLISNNRQTVHAEKRAELDYEVSVRTYRDLHEIDVRLDTILQRLDQLEEAVRSRA